MHVMFASAPLEIRESVAQWIRSGARARAACKRIDGWIAERLLELPPAPVRRIAARTRGAHHDLEVLAEPLWSSCFAADFGGARGRPACSWGKAGRSRTRHSLRLGSYVQERHLVRLHPVLDQAGVPAWFVRFVLFHELLHAALPPVRGADERWIHHGAEFRRRERAHPDHARALAWEEAHLTRLIRSARTGKPIGGTQVDRESARQRLLF